ncbi:MAG: hypothetical protein NW220_14750 [Leptolyngbyaceae cyanobacterium bins.349]|nr:hypothetical protein [Leptolyngbyaceae cyanobacterium bins.349]
MSLRSQTGKTLQEVTARATGIRTLTTQVTSWQTLQDLTCTLAIEIGANPKTLILVDAGDGAIAQLKTAPF